MNIPWSEERARKLRKLRAKNRKTVSDAIQNTGLQNEKALHRWETNQVENVREHNLIKVLHNLDTTIDDFLEYDVRNAPINLPGSVGIESPSFENLLTTSEAVDKTLFAVLQGKRAITERAEIHRSLLYGGLVTRGFSFTHFIDSLRKLRPTPHAAAVSLSLDKQLSSLKIAIRDNAVLEVSHPTLMWPCSCLPLPVAENLNRDGRKPKRCLIHSHPRGEELRDLASRGLIELRFRDTSILWRQSILLWPPSIDSVLTLKNLEQAGIFRIRAESVLDLGAGTGILGIVFARTNQAVRRVDFSDWLLTPLLFSALNAARNLSSVAIDWNVHLGMFHDWMTAPFTKIYDVVVCTPPYLPDGEDFAEVRKHSPVAGTDLLEFIFEQRLGRRTFITVSTLVRRMINALAKKNKVRLKEIGQSMEVPFRVPPALRSSNYIGSLLASGDLKFTPQNRFSLWHRIATFELTR